MQKSRWKRVAVGPHEYSRKSRKRYLSARNRLKSEAKKEIKNALETRK